MHTLGAILLENILASKGVTRYEGITRAGQNS